MNQQTNYKERAERVAPALIGLGMAEAQYSLQESMSDVLTETVWRKPPNVSPPVFLDELHGV